MVLDRPHRREAETLGAVGERHLGSPHLVVRPPVEVLKEVPMPDVHQSAPRLQMPGV